MSSQHPSVPFVAAVWFISRLLFDPADILAERPFEIRFIDGETSRGVPLVELSTVDDVPLVTDNTGRIAIEDPDLTNQRVFFRVRAQGYTIPKDGLGIAGIRCVIRPGQRKQVVLQRLNPAERLYRITGAGRYRETRRLGINVPDAALNNGLVVGQDSIQAAVYRGKIHWFWGDTNRQSYLLGLFRTAGAVSRMPDPDHDLATQPLRMQYFTRDDGFARAMVEVADPKGVVWIDGVTTIPDATGNERMVCRFSRRPGLAKAYEQGLMLYNEERDMFEVATKVPVDEHWRHLHNHPVRYRAQEREFLLCGSPYLTTRVPAQWDAVQDPDQYESWSCLARDDQTGQGPPERDSAGRLEYRWQAGPPVTPRIEQRWIKAGLIEPDEARFLPVDVAKPEHRVAMHSGTVRWNPYRQRWIVVAIELATMKDSPSMLGEVWYSESTSPQGPFKKAVRIVTHDRQSFYNPCHHAFLDRDGGRTIHFEGTYCNTFTNSPPTPRYNYNQIMYRLDLNHAHVQRAWEQAKP